MFSQSYHVTKAVGRFWSKNKELSIHNPVFFKHAFNIYLFYLFICQQIERSITEREQKFVSNVSDLCNDSK